MGPTSRCIGSWARAEVAGGRSSDVEFARAVAATPFRSRSCRQQDRDDALDREPARVENDGVEGRVVEANVEERVHPGPLDVLGARHLARCLSKSTSSSPALGGA